MRNLALTLGTFAAAALAVSTLNARPTDSTPVEVSVTNTPLAVTAPIEPISMCALVYNPTDLYTVPADRILVVEDATVRATVEPGEVVVGYLKTTAGGAEADHYVGTLDGNAFLFPGDGRAMTAYAEPGTTVVATAARRNSPENIKVCFTGRLEPTP